MVMGSGHASAVERCSVTPIRSWMVCTVRVIFRHNPCSNSGLVQVALCSHLVSTLAARETPTELAGHAAACFGAAVLTTTARLMRRLDAEVSYLNM